MFQRNGPWLEAPNEPLNDVLSLEKILKVRTAVGNVASDAVEFGGSDFSRRYMARE